MLAGVALGLCAFSAIWRFGLGKFVLSALFISGSLGCLAGVVHSLKLGFVVPGRNAAPATKTNDPGMYWFTVAAFACFGVGLLYFGVRVLVE
jgi:hypothetical protein